MTEDMGELAFDTEVYTTLEIERIARMALILPENVKVRHKCR